MPAVKLTSTPGGKRGKIPQWKFEYIMDQIRLAAIQSERHGGGLGKDTSWRKARQMYSLEVNGAAPEASAILGDSFWSNMRVALMQNTVRRQEAKLRFDNPEVVAKATDVVWEVPNRMQVQNYLNYYIRNVIEFDVMSDTTVRRALLNPFGVVKFSWISDGTKDEALIEPILPEYVIPDPNLETWELNDGRFVVEVRFYTLDELRRVQWYYNVDEVKPNIVPRDDNGVPITAAESKLLDGGSKEIPKDWQFHNDTICVYWFWDKSNKTITAIPKDCGFEIGTKDWPDNGIDGFPFEVLMFNPAADGFYGLSDVARAEASVTQLCKAKGYTLAKWKASIPKVLGDARMFDEGVAEALFSPIANDFVKFQNVPAGKSLRDAIMELTPVGVTQADIIAINLLKDEVAVDTDIRDAERTGAGGQGETATFTQLSDQYAQTITGHRMALRNRFLSRCVEKLQAMTNKMWEGEKSIPWVIKDKPTWDEGIEWTVVRKDQLVGKFKFDVDVTSGEVTSKVMDKRNLVEFLSVMSQLGAAPSPLDDASLEYVIKESARRYGFNADKINVKKAPPPQPQLQMPMPGAAEGGPQMGTPPGAPPVSPQGGEAMMTPGKIAEAMMAAKGAM